MSHSYVASKAARSGESSGARSTFVGANFFGFFDWRDSFQSDFENFLNFNRRKYRLLDSRG